MSRKIYEMPEMGSKFGKRIVIAQFSDNKSVRLRCECGREITIGLSRLFNLKPESCISCERHDQKRKHGESGPDATPEYIAWKAMLRRCYNPNCTHYEYYGGKGVRVCDRWRYSYENFLADVGRKPSPDRSLDKLNNNEWYGPDNFRWATKEEQMNNRSNNRWIEHNGETLTISQWAKRFNLRTGTLCNRIKRGWDFEVALTTPLLDKEETLRRSIAGRKPKIVCPIKEKKITLTDLAKQHNIKVGTLFARLKSGWEMQRALTTPTGNNGCKSHNCSSDKVIS